MSANARRSTCALKAPASPRSPVIGTIATVLTFSRCSSKGGRTAPAACEVPAISSIIRSAYGRIPSIRICARRRRAEATSSIARVSLRVFEIERTRRFRSWVDAKELRGLGDVEHVLELLDRRVELLRGRVVEVAGRLDRLQDLALGAQ